MTCFWTAILKTLNEEERKILNLSNNLIEKELVICLKDRSDTLVNANVLWQGEQLRPQLCRELKMWVDNYNVNDICNGHDTSSCDPFLTLLTELLGWRIEFKYMESLIVFQPRKGSKRSVLFGANNHHFYIR